MGAQMDKIACKTAQWAKDLAPEGTPAADACGAPLHGFDGCGRWTDPMPDDEQKAEPLGLAGRLRGGSEPEPEPELEPEPEPETETEAADPYFYPQKLASGDVDWKALIDAQGHAAIPQGVTTIPSGAFAYTNVKSVSFPEGLATIAGQNILAHAGYPDGNGGAFEDCGSLVSVGRLPASLKSIGECAFQGCGALDGESTGQIGALNPSALLTDKQANWQDYAAF